MVGVGAFGAPPGGVAIPRGNAPGEVGHVLPHPPDATVRTNVRRLVRRELASALAALDEPGALGLQETLHDVRKRCKKVRDVLRLARPGPGAE